MLKGLKNLLKQADEQKFSVLSEASSRVDDEDIRDRFMEDEDILLMDGEDDPKIKKLIDDLPEDEFAEGLNDDDVEELVESFLPEDIGEQTYTGTFSWMYK